MGQITQLTVNDGSATPVSQVYDAYDRTGLKSVFRNSAATLLRGMKFFIHAVIPANKPGMSESVRMEWTFPTEKTVDGITTVGDVGRAELVLRYPQGIPVSTREAWYGIVQNTLANANVKAQTCNGAPLAP